MNEKFIYPLLAILLAVISTNVNAAITSKVNIFSWQGFIPVIDSAFDWQFVDKLGNPYDSSTPAFLTVGLSSDKSGIDILGAPIRFYIAPKYYDGQTPTNNAINEVTAKLIENPTHTGFKEQTMITNAETAVPGNNQVAIIVNGDPINETTETSLKPMGNNPSLFEVSIILKAKITSGSYAENKYIGFTIPIMFSVNVTS